MMINADFAEHGNQILVIMYKTLDNPPGISPSKN